MKPYWKQVFERLLVTIYLGWSILVTICCIILLGWGPDSEKGIVLLTLIVSQTTAFAVYKAVVWIFQLDDLLKRG
jgi:hypothetical protein